MDIDVDPVSPDILSQHPVTPTQPNKQKRPIVHDNTPIRPNPFVFTQTKKSEIERKILEARDLILGASVIAKGTPEQNDLLDLLEIFREYTEKKKVRQTSSILAKQINNLEKATKKIEQQPRTYATVTGQSTSKELDNAIKSPWSVVQKKKPSSKESILEKRVIITLANPEVTINSQKTRDEINKAIGVTAVAAVARTRNNNIVITTTTKYNANILLENKEKWDSIIPQSSEIRKDEEWHKVVLHGVPIAAFPDLATISEEIQQYNEDLALEFRGKPFWLTTEEKRQTQRCGSAVIAFKTKEQAEKAIRYRLYVAGLSLRVDKFFTVAKTTQCPKCLTFGHLPNRCTRPTRCKYCAQTHDSKEHACADCGKKTECEHMQIKCANCGKAHLATAKHCEVFRSLLRPRNE